MFRSILKTVFACAIAGMCEGFSLMPIAHQLRILRYLAIFSANFFRKWLSCKLRIKFAANRYSCHCPPAQIFVKQLTVEFNYRHRRFGTGLCTILAEHGPYTEPWQCGPRPGPRQRSLTMMMPAFLGVIFVVKRMLQPTCALIEWSKGKWSLPVIESIRRRRDRPCLAYTLYFQGTIVPLALHSAPWGCLR